MPTLYEILGVAKDASAAQIKRGYHTMSKRHHPDKPHGNAELFREVDRAYKVLSNPDKRAFYDQHGTTPEDKPQPSENAEMYGVIQNTLNHVLQNGDPDTFDVVTSMRRTIENEISNVKNAIKDGNKKKARLEKAMKRFRCKAEENIIAKMLQPQIDVITNGIATMDRGVEMLGKALVFLDDYGYDFDAPSQSAGHGLQQFSFSHPD